MWEQTCVDVKFPCTIIRKLCHQWVSILVEPKYFSLYLSKISPITFCYTCYMRGSGNYYDPVVDLFKVNVSNS